MERLLHYVWKYKLYAPAPLATTEGQTLEIIDPDRSYVGFAVARGCNVTVDNVSMVISDPATDPPAQSEPDALLLPLIAPACRPMRPPVCCSLGFIEEMDSPHRFAVEPQYIVVQIRYCEADRLRSAIKANVIIPLIIHLTHPSTLVKIKDVT